MGSIRSTLSPSLIVCCARLSSIIRSSLIACGTVCRIMSRLHHHCLSSAAAWRHISLGAQCFPWLHPQQLLLCGAWEVTPSLSDTLIVLVSYLLPYLPITLIDCFAPHVLGEKPPNFWRQFSNVALAHLWICGNVRFIDFRVIIRLISEWTRWQQNAEVGKKRV